MLEKAKNHFQFYETSQETSLYIYKQFNIKSKKKIIDICTGLGSLIKPFYDDEYEHDITLIELNNDFIPILKKKFKNCKIINDDFFNIKELDYDIILCNPPFKINNIYVYKHFYYKIISMMKYYSTLIFICPSSFIKGKCCPNINKFDSNYNKKYLNDFQIYEMFGFFEIDSEKLVLKKTEKKYMLEKKIINLNVFDMYQYILFLKYVNDFENTKVNCLLLKINV